MHVHVLPRRPGDFEPNDKVGRWVRMCVWWAALSLVASLPRSFDILIMHPPHGGQVYEELEAVHLKKHFDLDADRRPRTAEEMAAEARELRALFPERQWRRG